MTEPELDAEATVTVEWGKAWGEMVAGAWSALVAAGMPKVHASQIVEAKFATAYVTYDDD